MRLTVRIVGLVLAGSLLALSAPVRASECGDGVIDPGETCDPPNYTIDPATGQAMCRSDCTACGDGVVQGNDYETCDDGPALICGFCVSNCHDRILPGDGYGGCVCGLDAPGLVDLRTDTLATCDCDNASRHDFLRCARAEVNAIDPELLMPPCRTSSIKCLTQSTCGRPGRVTCCRTSANGRKRCAVKPDAAHCTAPSGGSASLGVSEDCCDACP